MSKEDKIIVYGTIALWLLMCLGSYLFLDEEWLAAAILFGGLGAAKRIWITMGKYSW